MIFGQIFSLVYYNQKKVSIKSILSNSNAQSVMETEPLTFGFSLISLCCSPVMVRPVMSIWIHCVLPAPEGPRTMIPWRTRWVSYNWISFMAQGGWLIKSAASIFSLEKEKRRIISQILVPRVPEPWYHDGQAGSRTTRSASWPRVEGWWKPLEKEGENRNCQNLKLS